MSDNSTQTAVWTAYGILLVTMVVWSSNVVIARYAMQDIPPLAFTFWRWIVVLAFLLPFVAKELIRERAYIAANWKILLLLATLSTVIFNGLFFVALEITMAVNAALMVGVLPVTIVFASRVILGERVSLRALVGMAVAFAGLVVVVIRGDIAVLETLSFHKGDLFILIALACFSAYSVLLKRRPEGLTPNGFIAVMVVIGIPPLVPFYLWEHGTGDVMDWTFEAFALMFYSGIIVWLLANVLWIRAIAIVGASTAGQFYYLLPIFGAIQAVLFLGEDFFRYHLVGLGLILIGIYLTLGARKEGAAKSAAALETVRPGADEGKG